MLTDEQLRTTVCAALQVQGRGRREAGKRTNPDGEEGDGNEDRGGYRPNSVGPAAGAVHDAVEQAQPPLHQRRARGVKDDLEVPLRALQALHIVAHPRMTLDCTGGEGQAWAPVTAALSVCMC